MDSIYQNIAVVILAAGKSTRMNSKLNKLMTQFEGQPLVHRVVSACQTHPFEKIILVVGPDSDALRNSFEPDTVGFAIQNERLGTGHALMQAVPHLARSVENVVVLAGDHPFVSPECLEFLVRQHRENQAAATVLTAVYNSPPGYGRILRDKGGRIQRIIEEKDATPEQRKIPEVNISTYCFHVPTVGPLLSQLQATNVQQEYYLTDIIEVLLKNQQQVHAIPYHDNSIGIGINSRIDLAKALAFSRKTHLERLMRDGVTVLDPDSTCIESSVKIGRDTVIYPFTCLESNTEIGSDCKIGPNVHLKNVTIGDQVVMEFAVMENTQIPSGTFVAPFSHIKNRI